MGLRELCQPRSDVLDWGQGDLPEEVFAAAFGDLIKGVAPPVYSDAAQFFQNTFPTVALQNLVQQIFGSLANPGEAGRAVQLSTGFGGGKTHTLMALWHLAQNVTDPTLGTELLPAAGRPGRVTVVALDGSRAGYPDFATHSDGVRTHSLAGEVFYQLGGPQAVVSLGEADHPERTPNLDDLEAIWPDGPVLVLLDELVIYLSMLQRQGQGAAAMLSFFNMLLKMSGRPQTVVVVTDTAGQTAYQGEAAQLASALEQLAGRVVSNIDPVGDQSAEIINRRLFEQISETGRNGAAAAWRYLLERLQQDHPELLPSNFSLQAFEEALRRSYPFHPRLLKTAQERLGALGDFQRSRGILRLFSRLLRTLWTPNTAGVAPADSLTLISAGEIDWAEPTLQAELLQRLQRQRFDAAIRSDLLGHARQLDDGPGGPHARAAAALLLESLDLTPASGFDEVELTVAALRPEDAGTELAEAAQRFAQVCWHLYESPARPGWQFRYQPNINKQIEDRKARIPLEDARQVARNQLRKGYGGTGFQVVAWPRTPHDVPDQPRLQLVLGESVAVAEQVVLTASDDPASATPRRYRNAIVALAPTPGLFDDAIDRARQWLAAHELLEEARRDPTREEDVKPLQQRLGTLERDLTLLVRRAFDQVVYVTDGAAGPIAVTMPLPQEYRTDEVLQSGEGQINLRRFLEKEDLIYSSAEALDPDFFADQVLPGITPVEPGIYTTAAAHERLLGGRGLRLVPDREFTVRTLVAALAAGKIVVRFRDGVAWDRSGGVTDEGARLTAPLPTHVPVSDDILFARAGDPAVAGWFPQPEPDRTGGGVVVPPPPPPALRALEADRWERIRELAADHPLRVLRLTAPTPAGAQKALGLVQFLPADAKRMTVTLEGPIASGARLSFFIEEVDPGDAVDPLEQYRRLQALVPEPEESQAVLTLTWTTGGTDLGEALADCARQASETIRVYAQFAPSGGDPA